jgi:prophage regulatory protein
MAWTRSLPGTPASASGPLVATMPRLLRLPQVMALVGLAEPTLYAEMNAGRFPRPVKITRRASAWREDDLIAWLATREAATAQGNTVA